MNVLKPMIHERQDALETALLRAVRRDSPPPGARHRMLATLGVSATSAAVSTAATKAAAAIAGASSKSASSAAMGLLIAKGTFLGLVGAVCFGAAIQVLPSRGDSAPPQATQRAAAVSQPIDRVIAASPGDLPPVAAKLIGELTPPNASGLAPTETRVAASGNAQSPKPTLAPKTSALAEEVALLDQARAAAAQSDPIRTLQLTSSYQRQFPSGAMAPEAQLLQVEALVHTGQSAAAMPIARKLLQAAPHGPHAERIRALLPDKDLNPPASNLRSSRGAFDTTQ